MHKVSKLLISLFLCVCLLASMFSAMAESPAIQIVEIQKYGNLVLAISGSDFLAQGYTYGDVVTMHLNGSEYDMPVGSNYSDVDNGSMVCRVVVNEEAGEDYVIVAINMGDLATTAGIAAKASVEEEPGYRWDYADGLATPVTLAFSMKEQGGYANEYQLRQLQRTNERTDYAHLTDEQFANFRSIATTGMGEHTLYRSSSPVNPELGRNAYADAALSAAGIRTVINLADSKQVLESYPDYAASAYASCSVIALNLGIDARAENFQHGLAEGLRFLIANEGPYLIHCTEGKDRAGFVSALLECLMGAPANEVVADYMTTYTNYYGVEAGSETYDKIASSNICKTLADVFEVADIVAQGVDLAAEAETYLLDQLHFSPEEVAQLKDKLAGR